MELYILSALAIIAILIIINVIASIFAMIKGAPYVPTSRKHMLTMLELAQITKEDLVMDLGSGDGKFLIESAKKGALAIGYEINPLLVILANLRARLTKTPGTSQTKLQNMWSADLPKATVVFLYAFGSIMTDLETKLQKELPEGARVISHVFTFPNWIPQKTIGSANLYVKNSSDYQSPQQTHL